MTAWDPSGVSSQLRGWGHPSSAVCGTLTQEFPEHPLLWLLIRSEPHSWQLSPALPSRDIHASVHAGTDRPYIWGLQQDCWGSTGGITGPSQCPGPGGGLREGFPRKLTLKLGPEATKLCLEICLGGGGGGGWYSGGKWGGNRGWGTPLGV